MMLYSLSSFVVDTPNVTKVISIVNIVIKNLIDNVIKQTYYVYIRLTTVAPYSTFSRNRNKPDTDSAYYALVKRVSVLYPLCKAQ